jgi:hypothetical protein
VVVEVAVDRRRPDADLRVRGMEALDALGRGTKRKSFAPRSFSRSTAAVAEFAVASMGSSTMTMRSARSSGALK